MKFAPIVLPTLLAFSGAYAWAQTNTISSVAIGTQPTAGGTATGVATVTPRIGTALNQPGTVLNNLAGLQYVAGNIPLTGAPASIAFWALTGAAVPTGGGPASAFTSYGTLTSPTAVTTYGDPASKLTPNSYSGLTWAAANLGFGSGNFYSIHHTPGTDYLSEIVPGTGTATLIADLKPMSWAGPTAGGPASIGTTGYFGLAWATGILSAGAPYADQSIYYLRTSTSGHTIFGVTIPALVSASSDTLDLTTAVGAFGAGGYTTLAFSPVAIGTYGANQFYYLRLDPITGNTILGWLNPSLIAGARTISDIANLGGVFNTLDFAADATGPAGAWGTNQFYLAGALPAGAQSISFAAIPNHNVGDVFTITPTASSALDIDVTVVSGPATVATTGTSGATPLSLRVFTVTTTGPGIVTLQARQAGRAAAPAFTANLLQQSFNVVGVPIITNSPLTAAGTVGTPFSFTITALGSPTSYAASPLPAGLSIVAATGVITGTPTTVGTTNVLLGATNAIGTGNATLAITVAAAGVAPLITNSPLTAAGTVGTLFSFTITASGSPTSYAASPLPAGLSIVAATGVIVGTPTTAGTTNVLLGATNAAGTGNVTLTITVAAAAVAPIITGPPNAPGTIGTPFSYTITASGSPTSYTASPLPAGLSIVAATGVITGTPTTAGTSVVTLGATNASGTRNTTLTITVAAANAAPIITSPTGAPGTVGTPFVTYLIAATGLPTSYAASGLPPGLTVNSLTGAITGTPTTAGTYGVTITATNSTGATTATVTITVGAFGVSPAITSQPNSQTMAIGSTAVFSVAASGSSTYQWYLNGGVIPGATGSRLVVSGATAINAGAYTATATNASGSVTSSAGTLAFLTTANPGRLGNMSVLSNFAAGQILTVGFVTGGAGTNGTQTLLIRAAGPALASFGVTGPMAHPSFQVIPLGQSTVIAANSNWGTPASNQSLVIAADSATGAFPFVSGFLDAATVATLTSGGYSIQVSGTGAGTALAELYDTTPIAAYSLTVPRLVNASCNTTLSAGGSLTAGFTVGGTTSKTVLIRASGPTLAGFGLTGTMADPQIVVQAAGAATVLASNAGWGGDPQIAAAASSVLAFPFVSASSTDSAVLITLAPGGYTAVASSASGGGGTTVVEIYEIP